MCEAFIHLKTMQKELDFELILSNVSRHVSLTEEERKCFTNLLKPLTIKGRKVLLREGEVCRNSTFVLKGCLRGYTVDKNGYEHILGFAPPNWWIADMYSLLSQKPGQLTIEAVTDTEVLQLPKSAQLELYNEVPKFERFFRIITENSLVAHQQRLIDNMSLSAEERYLKFCKVYPDLIFTLPQKQIAAYIGITPEFLSKMKARMQKRPRL